MFISMVPHGLPGEFIQSIWLHDGTSSKQGQELRLPTGAVELVLNLREDCFFLSDATGARRVYPGALVVGPHQRAYVLDSAQQSRVLGVVFRPGRARPLVGVPLYELAERHVALENLWGYECLPTARECARRARCSDAATRTRVRTARPPGTLGWSRTSTS